MFTHCRTEGIILKRIDRGEADQLLIVYTRDFGRLDVVAKGIRKIASKLRSAVEFPAVIELEFIQGKTCKTLTDAVILIPLKHLLRQPRKQDAICRIFGMTEALIKDQQPDGKIWGLLLAVLAFTDATGERNTEAVYQYFVWHIFEFLGWRPEFGESYAGLACRSLVCFSGTPISNVPRKCD